MWEEEEINRDYYCGADYFDSGDCFKPGNIIEPCSEEFCHHCHRKWPTPDQFKEEYDENWYGAVYVMEYGKDLQSYWRCYDKGGNVAYADYEFVVCACTPWGKPSDNWRPE